MQNRNTTRRKNLRVIEPLRILVFWKGLSGRYEADICDIGIGGCFLNSNTMAKSGELITLEIPISMQTEQVFELYGTVIPQKRKFKGFGVCFENLNEVQQELLTELIVQANEQRDRRNES